MVPPAVPRESSAVIVRRLEKALEGREGEGVLAFDADGTLWSGDVGIDLFEAALEARALREEARAALAAEATSIGLVARGDANDMARSLYAALEDGRYDEGRAFAMMAWSFAGFLPDELARFAADVLDHGRIEARIRRS